MYFSKEYKDRISSIVRTEEGQGSKRKSVVHITFKQWWKFSKSYTFQWIRNSYDEVRDISTYIQPTEEINQLLKALQD